MQTHPPPLFPPTTLPDVLLMYGIALLVSVVDHFWKGRNASLRKEAARLLKKDSEDTPEPKISEASMARVQQFHKSWSSIALAAMPFFAFATAPATLSLLRDAGWMVFPWPALPFYLGAGASFSFARLIRDRLLRRALAAPDDPLPHSQRP